MSEKKSNTTVKTTDAQTVGKTESKYSKEQILASATFANRRDILNALLDDGKEYTIAEVNNIMNGWLKKGVK